MENNKLDKRTYETFFIYNHENKGYSSGNNIDIWIADYLGVDAVLIANPDMQFENENYVYELTKTLFSNDTYAVTSFKIIGLEEKDQSPLIEVNFYENTFLYFAEPIFRVQVNTKNSYIIFNPEFKAIHDIGYNQIQLMLLNFFYALLITSHNIKSKVRK